MHRQHVFGIMEMFFIFSTFSFPIQITLIFTTPVALNHVYVENTSMQRDRQTNMQANHFTKVHSYVKYILQPFVKNHRLSLKL